jgi:hypothetical protein
MRIDKVVFVVFAWTAMPAMVGCMLAQSPAHGASPARTNGARAVPSIHATLAQLMKGILYPSANVFLDSESENPDGVPPAKDPSMATNPLASTYGKWEAVENSALAIAEAANLLTIPGRKCSNGSSVPTGDPDWPRLVERLREAGLAGYKAAQSRNHEKILQATGALNAACSTCHERYREKKSHEIQCPVE